MSYGTLVSSRHGAVALIELVSEDGMNCYTPEMGEDLVAALRAAAADNAVAAIVLTGSGRAFCAGAHRRVLAGEIGASGLTIGQEHFIAGFAPEFAAIPKLTIAAFNGAAVGIGVTMSLLCDLRLAVPGAKLRLNFAELGIMPGLGSTKTLVDIVGLPAAKKLLLCERTILAEDAAAIGLVDEVLTADTLLERALALGEAAAGGQRHVAAAIKAALNAGRDGDIADALRREADAAAALRRSAETQAIRYDDYDAFAKVEATGFIPWGEAIPVGRETVQRFLEVTGAPGDGAIIPGVMLQAMLPKLVPGHGWSVTGHSGAVNLGSPTIRFPVPAPAGAKLRGRSRLSAAKPHPKGTLIAMAFELREDGVDQPCLQSTIELLYLGAPS